MTGAEWISHYLESVPEPCDDRAFIASVVSVLDSAMSHDDLSRIGQRIMREPATERDRVLARLLCVEARRAVGMRRFAWSTRPVDWERHAPLRRGRGGWWRGPDGGAEADLDGAGDVPEAGEAADPDGPE